MAKKKVFSISSSLSEGLEQTIVAAQNYSGSLRIDVIPLTKIELDPENPRTLSLTIDELINGFSTHDPMHLKKSEDLAALQTLATSITEQGLINPILVYEHFGMYRLIAGERRTLASLMAKKNDIQAKILESKPDELKIRLLQWIENMERSDLSLHERMDNLTKIVSAFSVQRNIRLQDVRITDISQLIGCTKSHALNIKAVLNADTDLKQLIAENKIRNLEKAALLSSIQSSVIRKRATTDCIKGATLKKLKIYQEQDKMQLSIHDRTETLQPDSMIIHFGATKNIRVAQTVFEAIIQYGDLKVKLPELRTINQANPKVIASAFKLLMKHLEEIHE